MPSVLSLTAKQCGRCGEGIKRGTYCSDRCRMLSWAIRELEKEGYVVTPSS